jgi:phosphoadenosine phosphosulfate reductase
MRLYKNGGFVEDPWRDLPEGEMPHGPSVLSLVRWRALGDAAEGINVPLGVRLEAGEPVEAILPDLPRLSLVALAFPKFNDGRSFSKAAQLRGQYGFAGEIRAVGDVLWDQLQLMRRCGFDAFAIEHEPTLRAIERGKTPFMSDFYQPGLGAEVAADPHRPWARRAMS